MYGVHIAINYIVVHAGGCVPNSLCNAVHSAPPPKHFVFSQLVDSIDRLLLHARVSIIHDKICFKTYIPIFNYFTLISPAIYFKAKV